MVEDFLLKCRDMDAGGYYSENWRDVKPLDSCQAFNIHE